MKKRKLSERKIRCAVSTICVNLKEGMWWDPYIQGKKVMPLLVTLSECNSDESWDEKTERMAKSPEERIIRGYHVVVTGDDAIKFHDGSIKPHDEIELLFKQIGETVKGDYFLLCDLRLITETRQGYGHEVKLIKRWWKEFMAEKVPPFTVLK